MKRARNVGDGVDDSKVKDKDTTTNTLKGILKRKEFYYYLVTLLSFKKAAPALFSALAGRQK